MFNPNQGMRKAWLKKLPVIKSILVSVIIPAYNEEQTLPELLQRLRKLQTKIRLETVLVDDGSTDETAKIAQEFPEVKTVQHVTNYGKGAAIRTALKHTTGDIVVVQDADLEYPPDNVLKLIGPILENQADVVYGSRFLGKNKGMSLSHKLGNNILSVAASFLYGTKITDIMTGHKAFSRKAIKSIELTEREFEIEVEITVKVLLLGWRFLEVPISYYYRRKGLPKIGYKHAVNSLIKLFINRIKIQREKKPRQLFFGQGN